MAILVDHGCSPWSILLLAKEEDQHKGAVGSVHDPAPVMASGELSRFRRELYASLTARSDALFELVEAVLCADGPVTSLVELTLVAEHRRGHGAMYDALNHGCIPGWPYSFVAALEPGRSSWTPLLDVVRLGPVDDPTAVTADRLRAVVARLVAAGQWRPGDPDILIVTDAGYDITRLAFVLADLPVELFGRIRSDRVLRRPKPPRRPGTTGRPLKHGPEFALDEPDTWPQPTHSTVTDTTRYGIATASSWDRLHPRLTHRGCWLDHDGELPVIEGTLIRLQVDHLPGDGDPKPVWLWSSVTGATSSDVNRWWQSFLRRFDLEHTFRLFKQTLGWTTPKIRDPAAADRWTWLIIAAHTQLRLARPLAADLRRPWEKPALPGRLTPARVRRSFRNLRPTTVLPASAPKPSRPGPGRPPGSRNRVPAPRHNVGKPPNASSPSPRSDSAQVKDQA